MVELIGTNMQPDLKKEVLKYFYRHLPNSLRDDHLLLAKEFKDYSRQEILNCLDELAQSSILFRNEKEISGIGVTRITYTLIDGADYPIETYITIGGLKLPRMIEGDTARSEDVNQALVGLGRVSEELEARLEEQLRSQLQHYWANLITIFGLFLALFSLIVTATPKLMQGSTLQGWERFIQNLVDISPLAIVLLFFVLFLRLLFGKRR